MASFQFIHHLGSGGLITNYYCSSRCRHCLYGCNPYWPKDFIDSDMVRLTCKQIRKLGCHSVHIGGGEPLLDPEGVKNVLVIMQEMGVSVDYIETNSSWFKDEGSACNLLETLIDLGLQTLLVSISPFHNEYIPFSKVRGVLHACRKTGMGVFPWVQNFAADIQRFDEQTTHSFDEYEKTFGPGFIPGIAGRYWLHSGGRALGYFRRFRSLFTADQILHRNNRPCSELADVSHFHFDLFGNYIPGLCSGLSIKTTDVGRPLESGDYPFLFQLFEQGISGFFEMATGEYGFETDRYYVSKCDLCLDIRTFLVREKSVDSADLQPAGMYEYMHKK